MELVAVVTALVLIQYIVLSVQVGQARGRYGVEAPATTGHPIFERHFRVHQNTLEQLAVFLPALWLFAVYVSAPIAAVLGLVFLVARVLYARGYVADPKQRSTGALLTAITTSVLLLGALIGAVVHLL
jgi:glutathione S-transferase